MGRTVPTLGVVLMGVSCAVSEPSTTHPGRDASSSDATQGTPTDPTAPDTTEGEAVDHPLGSRWEEERRRALAGCVQTVSGELTGAVYAVHRFDEHGWPVQNTLFSGDRVASDVHTTYERVDGRVVASEAVTLEGAELVDTGVACDDVVKTVATTYDAAQRPLEAVTIVEGCGVVSEVVRTYEHLVEDDELVHTVAYDDGKQVHYTIYDSCAMVKRLDGERYRNHYDDEVCELRMVEMRRYKWFWHYEDQRPVRFTADGNPNDTLYAHEGCLR